MEALERYRHLGLSEAFTLIATYPLACSELSTILRRAYSKVPKSLQSLLFHDTLAAFRLLPQMATSRAVSAANLLLHAAEFAFPKQKKSLAVTEFKHAVVAHKRRCKPPKDQEGSASLPEDVLVHVFSFLDMRSLVAASSVCWSWNSAAADDGLWHSQYVQFFGNSDGVKTSTPIMQAREEQEDTTLGDFKGPKATSSNFGWKEEFKRSYIGIPACKSASNRGYCVHCKSIIWLSKASCAKPHHILNNKNRRRDVIPLSPTQVVAYLLGDSFWLSSSDSDEDSDSEESQWMDQQFTKLWAVPRHMLYK